MTMGLKANADGSGAIQVGGSDAITITSGLVTSINGGVGGLVSGTAQASTSGTSIDFTSIPSWVKRITVMFQGVSTNGTNPVIVQLGAGSIETTSYLATQGIIITTSASSGGYTTGFPVGGVDIANIRSGIMQIATLGSNIWVASAVIKGGSGTIGYSAGDKTLSGTLDRLRIIGSTTGSPTDTFDAGSINIFYE
jgi:hypothetical protein